MSSAALDIVVLGLSLRSSWGNGHATTWRALLRALAERGHRVRFLERDMPWYAENADLPQDLPVDLSIYGSLEELDDLHRGDVAAADLVLVGSYVPDGIAVGDWVQRHARGRTAFYDIDTPVTLARLARHDCAYLSAAQIPQYDVYLSFSGGPLLDVLRQRHGACRAEPLYCAVDPSLYFPEPEPERFDLGYMGTYSDDRQPPLEKLLLEPARRWPEGRFVVAGPQYPPHIAWPENVHRIEHLAPARHRSFYNSQRFTLNVTRSDMVAAGWSPSVRLFEAAACATPIVSDHWAGLETLFAPDREILIADTPEQVLGWLRSMPEEQRRALGRRARERVLAEHTAAHRAESLERLFEGSGRHRASSPPSTRDHMEVCHGSST